MMFTLNVYHILLIEAISLMMLQVNKTLTKPIRRNKKTISLMAFDALNCKYIHKSGIRKQISASIITDMTIHSGFETAN